jgi:hypothetical protein
MGVDKSDTFIETEHEFEYEIASDRMRPIAARLVEKYEELRHINVERILFFINHKSGGSKKKIVLARTRRIPAKWGDILFQFMDRRCLYSIEIIGKATASLDENQIVALLYREMLLIGPDGNILTPDTNDWWHVITGLGRHWFYPGSDCPNLLASNTDWKKLLGANFTPPRVA